MRHYCIDGVQHSCLDLDIQDKDFAITAYIKGSVTTASDPTQCQCNWEFKNGERWDRVLYSRECLYGIDYNYPYVKYDWCKTGYYVTKPKNWGDWYSDCEACTNKPAHSHYTSYSTPSVMYAVEDNCPWECDADYGRSGDTCVPLCNAGATEFHVGNHVFNMYPNSACASPAIRIGLPNGICCVKLESGPAAGAINVKIGEDVWHTTD